MKLVSCHIENFGKLQNYDYSFGDEKSIIHEDNGWGKSTFATFIRVMFFGFIGENKRNITENERKRFKPWQMGTYGGNVVFSVNGKEYRMERRFGEKKSGSDEFALYDNTTNLKSDDYSSNIGEELFGIDLESFMRTVFIAQQDCGTEVTPSISAKIGNVSDQTADMGNYDVVQNTLKDEMNKLSPERATGKLSKMNMRISELREVVRNKEYYINNLTELGKKLEEQVDAKEKKQEEQKDIQKELERVSALKDSQAGAEKYKELCEQEADAKQKYENAKAFFPKDVPEKTNIDIVVKRCDEYEDLLQTIKNFSLSDDESRSFSALKVAFSAGVPDESKLNDIEESIDKLSELESERDACLLSDPERIKLDDAEKLFEHYRPSMDEVDGLINDWGERKSKKEVLSSKRLNAELFKNANSANSSMGSSNKTLGIIIIVVGIIATLCGIVTIVSVKSNALGAGIAVAGIVLAIVGTTLSFRKNNENLDNNNSTYNKMLDEISRDEVFIQRVEQVCKDMFDKLGLQYNEYDVPTELNRIRNLIRDYDELFDRDQKGNSPEREKEMKTLVDTITGFLKEYHQDILGADYQKALYQLKNNASDYIRIKAKQDKVLSASEESTAIENEVKNYLMSLGFEPEEELKKQLSTINEKLISLNYLNEGLKNITGRKEKFEKDNDVTKFIDSADVAEVASLEELNKSFNELKEQIDSIADIEDSFREQMDEAAQELEALENDEAELERLQENYETDMRKYQIIGKTREYLEKAKYNFSCKYMDDIKDSFEKYHNIISDSDEKYELDANLNIQLKEKGSLHELAYLSEGYKDLVGLCRRMAMVDAMYDQEKPFLIFDDPFVNLDESRLAGAMNFLDDLAKDYQIVYFACHQSRC
ncbi:DNA repair exonuclease SbcCD ATPase subunit [Butyrivibrio sp. Su6]|uniref:AAA family ATPase n=1 Tax=Butyrivibrio sp. Su6 TaxID=1520810 RepID=UPI00089E90DB|nr:AAA family ATPase [Butyrivibrio sp. Su6]SEF61815.1 DNA repair exonuclease SbcCD ATPase subunit [Butyrivibrio sp. Su6]